MGLATPATCLSSMQKDWWVMHLVFWMHMQATDTYRVALAVHIGVLKLLETPGWLDASLEELAAPAPS